MSRVRALATMGDSILPPPPTPLPRDESKSEPKSEVVSAPAPKSRGSTHLRDTIAGSRVRLDRDLGEPSTDIKEAFLGLGIPIATLRQPPTHTVNNSPLPAMVLSSSVGDGVDKGGTGEAPAHPKFPGGRALVPSKEVCQIVREETLAGEGN